MIPRCEYAKDLPNQDGYSVVVSVPVHPDINVSRVIRLCDNIASEELAKHIAEHLAAAFSAVASMWKAYPEREATILAISTEGFADLETKCLKTGPKRQPDPTAH